MPKWKYRGSDDSDHLASYDKIRRGKDKRKKQKSADGDFELLESQWDVSDPSSFKARVVEVHKGYAFISREDEIGLVDTKDVWLATVARKFLQSERKERNTIAVGDRVLCIPGEKQADTLESDLPRCVIQKLAPRTSKIARKDPLNDSREHVLASNIDQIIIVASYVSPLVKWGLIDRYLVLAEEQGIPAIVVLNKKDLLAKESEAFQHKCAEEVATYKKLGYEVIELVAVDENDQGVQVLESILEKKISIFTGHSGVGKSSLVNRFNPEIVQEVEPNSDIFYKGRHTTTYASFIKIASKGYAVDTPGIRSFTVGHRSAIDWTFGFRELRPFMGKCKFRECRHIDEPDCAVIEALNKGIISQRRYRSYCGLLLGETGREGRVRDDQVE